MFAGSAAVLRSGFMGWTFIYGRTPWVENCLWVYTYGLCDLLVSSVTISDANIISLFFFPSGRKGKESVQRVTVSIFLCACVSGCVCARVSRILPFHPAFSSASRRTRLQANRGWHKHADYSDEACFEYEVKNI